jgi:hypothetical protein
MSEFMKFCPVVPEVCRGHQFTVHGKKKKENNDNNNNNKI